MVTLQREDEQTMAESLPSEFVLNLGNQASDYIATLAKSLERMGARIELREDGVLVAVRPSA